MNSPHEGHIEPVQERGDGVVGLDHKHLDDRVRIAVICGMGIYDLARFVEQKLGLRQVQV